ncbi:MAG: transglycosylase domain-containing protein [Anaerolineae bacterium]|nr:transglycosylase domain-containing protein [Anaerolineae bacterium]
MTDRPLRSRSQDGQDGSEAPDEWKQTVTGSTPPDDATRPDADEPLPLTSHDLTYDHCRRVEWEVGQLRRQYNSSLITREDFAARLRELMLRDKRGRWWMVGTESNDWYVREGKEWVRRIPPVYKSESKPASASEPPTITMDSPAQESTPPGKSTPKAGPAAPKDAGEPPVGRPPAVTDKAATVVNDKAAYNFEPQVTQVAGGGRDEPPPPAAQPTIVHFPSQRGPAPVAQPTMPHPVDFIDYDPADHQPPPEAPQRRIRDTVLRFALLFGGVAMAALALFLGIVLLTTLVVINRYRAEIEALPQIIAQFQSTRIYDAQLNLIAELNSVEGRRMAVDLDKISVYMVHAAIAAENERFYDDPGYDLIAIARALLQNFLAGDIQSGASTITQQVVHWTILKPEQGYDQSAWRKVQEIILAAEVNRRYSKNEILGFYLNSVFFGNMAYGVEAAAQTYFDKPAEKLEPAEAAFLAGLVQAPAYYDPVLYPDRAFERMDTVLHLMAAANGDGCIQFQHGNLAETQTPLCVREVDWLESQQRVKSLTFHPPALDMKYPHFALYVRDVLRESYGEEFFTKGYSVYTTLDPRIQELAQQEVTDQIIRMNYTIHNAAVVVIRPVDGAIHAMVGSADYASDPIQGQINMAVVPRQPGSSIKPFVYLAAMEMNQDWWTPATIIWDVPVTFQDNYKPRNFDGEFHGPQALRYALGNSYNIPAVKAYQHAGWDRFSNIAGRFGITLHGDETNTGLSVALGAREVTLLDMTAAYAALANGGAWYEPYTVSRIVEPDGAEFYSHSLQPPAPVQAVAPAYAYLMSSILSDASARAAEFGAGWWLTLPDGRPAAVKTGTTSDPERDAWTLGYTPQFAVGVWVGNADNSPIPSGSAGSTAAAPIWRNTLQGALELDDRPPMNFPMPADRVVQLNVCTDTGARYWDGCQGSRSEWFEVDHQPPAPENDFLKVVSVDSATGLLANEWCPNNVVKRRYLQLTDLSAIDWINGTTEGRAWAESYGVAVPLQSAPTQACSRDTQPTTVIITSPVSGQEVGGVVNVVGTVSMPNFHRYQLEYAAGVNPIGWGIADGPYQRTVMSSTLAQWDTRSLAHGVYTIRIIAFDASGGTAEYQIVVNVRNVEPVTATPFPTVTPLPTTTPLPPTFTPTLTPTDTPVIAPTDTLPPSFTPEPTLTLTPTETPTETSVP